VRAAVVTCQPIGTVNVAPLAVADAVTADVARQPMRVMRDR